VYEIPAGAILALDMRGSSFVAGRQSGEVLMTRKLDFIKQEIRALGATIVWDFTTGCRL